MDMGIDTFLISSTVVSVVTQRLVRKICPQCKTTYQPSPKLMEKFQNEELLSGKFKFYKGVGCKFCEFSGYFGRTGIFELLILNDPIRNAILAKRTSSEIRLIARRTANLISLREDGLYKSLLGVTTPDEVIRVVFHTESDEETGRTVEEVFNVFDSQGAYKALLSSFND